MKSGGSSGQVAKGWGRGRVLEVCKQVEVNKKKRTGIEHAAQRKSSRARRLVLEAEFWADWSGKEVKGIKRQRFQ